MKYSQKVRILLSKVFENSLQRAHFLENSASCWPWVSVKPGTPRNTPEHPRNTPEHPRNTPEQPGTPRNNSGTPLEHPIIPPNTLETARNTPGIPKIVVSGRTAHELTKTFAGHPEISEHFKNVSEYFLRFYKQRASSQ